MQLEINKFNTCIAVHFADCCLPLPQEDIIGLTTIDSGLFIHSSECSTLTNENKKNDWISATWKNVTDDQYFSSRIKVSVSNEPGSLGKLATIVGNLEGNITNLNISEKGKDFFDMIFVIDVHNLDHLNEIIDSLKQVSNVSSVNRLFINL